jgi:hypothetical protein
MEDFYQPAAAVDDAQGLVPIGLLVGDIRHQAGHLRLGILGGARLVHHRPFALVPDGSGKYTPMVMQERTRDIAARTCDKSPIRAPMRARLEAFRVALHGVGAHLDREVVVARIGEADAPTVLQLDRVEVDHLGVEQPPLVVVEQRQFGV